MAKVATEEAVELHITRNHLQIAGTIITCLLSAVVWFLADAAGELKTLSKTVTEFATYQKTNDLILTQLKEDLAAHKTEGKGKIELYEAAFKDFERRLTTLETKAK